MKQPRKTAKASSKGTSSSKQSKRPPARGKQPNGQPGDVSTSTVKPVKAADSPPKTKIERKVIPRADKRRGKNTDVGWHERFIEVFSLEPCISTACDAAGVSRSTFYDHEKKFPNFAEQVKEASERSVDVLERYAYLRATVGVPRKKFTSKGKPLIDPDTGKQYVEYEHSDALTQFLLKHQRPEKYGVDKSKVEVSGKITMTEEEENALGDAQLANITLKMQAAATSGKKQ